MSIAEKRQKKLDEILLKQEVANFAGELTRARSVTVGTAFGGTTEISMRSANGNHVWCLMQPVETIELIHQLAANVGCHIQLKPRDDFSSWRDWKVSETEKLHLQGHPPFPNDISPHNQVGANLPPPEQQPGLKLSQEIRSPENVVATKKTVNKRSAKRTAASS